MVTAFFMVFGVGVGVGMGTVLAKHIATKRAPYSFRWKNVEYSVARKG